MKTFLKSCSFRVIFLALLIVFITAGCSYRHGLHPEICKTHAYVSTPVDLYVNQRFIKGTTPRLAVIPFTVPANLSSYGSERSGLGLTLAHKFQANLLQLDAVPIIEVFNRQDWPGKRDEFFSGNFGAMAQAKSAGYDLILVGYVEDLANLESLSGYIKVIDVESHQTVWFGKIAVSSSRDTHNKVDARIGLAQRDPSRIFIDNLVDSFSTCGSNLLVETDDSPKPTTP